VGAFIRQAPRTGWTNGLHLAIQDVTKGKEIVAGKITTSTTVKAS
jgi:hypothetical protein